MKTERKIYCTNVHLRIIEILITLMYNLSAVTAAVKTLTQPSTHVATFYLPRGHLTPPHPPPDVAFTPPACYKKLSKLETFTALGLQITPCLLPTC